MCFSLFCTVFKNPKLFLKFFKTRINIFVYILTKLSYLNGNINGVLHVSFIFSKSSEEDQLKKLNFCVVRKDKRLKNYWNSENQNMFCHPLIMLLDHCAFLDLHHFYRNLKRSNERNFQIPVTIVQIQLVQVFFAFEYYSIYCRIFSSVIFHSFVRLKKRDN